MPDRPDDRRTNLARKKAQDHFTGSSQRDSAVRQEREKERASVAAKTAKLRALRLAKEESESAAAPKKTPARRTD